MAKRTKLTAPSAEEIAKMDADFRSENRPRPNPATAPIAQVAAETAQISPVEPAQQKLDRLDAERLRSAQEQGLLVTEIPTDKIVENAMIRDRTIIDEAEFYELKISIRAHGLRLPIEVTEAEDGKYNLISGYRRLLAYRDLSELNTGDGAYETIKAFIRPKTDQAEAFVAMVEENEIRSDLSHYERGRIAVVAAQQEIFSNTEAAVNALFSSASAAKKSKIKSFAEVFEMLGDLMEFPENLSERKGLRLAGALRQGDQRRFREVLETGHPTTPDMEWALLEGVIEEVEAGPVKVAKRGRPKLPEDGWAKAGTIRLASGVKLEREFDGRGYIIRISGPGVDREIMDSAIAYLQYAFDKPD